MFGTSALGVLTLDTLSQWYPLLNVGTHCKTGDKILCENVQTFIIKQRDRTAVYIG